jgi:hypothetical protein
MIRLSLQCGNESLQCGNETGQPKEYVCESHLVSCMENKRKRKEKKRNNREWKTNTACTVALGKGIKISCIHQSPHTGISQFTMHVRALKKH